MNRLPFRMLLLIGNAILAVKWKQVYDVKKDKWSAIHFSVSSVCTISALQLVLMTIFMGED